MHPFCDVHIRGRAASTSLSRTSVSRFFFVGAYFRGDATALLAYTEEAPEEGATKTDGDKKTK